MTEFPEMYTVLYQHFDINYSDLLNEPGFSNT